ncbi:hypothetical protein HMPREF1554_01082, partial [Porphyromonas gingivalis F0569]
MFSLFIFCNYRLSTTWYKIIEKKHEACFYFPGLSHLDLSEI